MNFTAIRHWLSRQRLRLSLLNRLGSRSVVGYGKLVYAIVTEGILIVPPRSRQHATNCEQPHSMEKTA